MLEIKPLVKIKSINKYRKENITKTKPRWNHQRKKGLVLLTKNKKNKGRKVGNPGGKAAIVEEREE